MKLFSFRKSRRQIDWPPPPEDKTTLEKRSLPWIRKTRLDSEAQKWEGGCGGGGGSWGESVKATL